MDLLEVVNRPSLDQLRQSHLDGTPCHFDLTSTGKQERFRLNGRVEFIKEYPDQRRVAVTFKESDSGGRNLRISVRISADDSLTGGVKVLCPTESIPLLWCGIEPRVRIKLVAAGIITLGDLKAHTEVAVCEKLHPSDTVPTQRSKKDAVQQFMQLRARLLSVGFTNPFQTNADGPAVRGTLRDAMFS